jgi:hypothetical protein
MCGVGCDCRVVLTSVCALLGSGIGLTSTMLLDLRGCGESGSGNKVSWKGEGDKYRAFKGQACLLHSCVYAKLIMG